MDTVDSRSSTIAPSRNAQVIDGNFTLVFAGVMSLVFLMVARLWVPDTNWWMFWLGLFIFSAIGFVANKWEQRQRERLGDLGLRLDPHPAILGGRIGGWIPAANLPGVTEGARVVLCCKLDEPLIEHFQHGGERVLWQEEKDAELVAAGGHSARASFSFVPPDCLPGSQTVDRGLGVDRYFWTLSIFSKGTYRFREEYEVTVQGPTIKPMHAWGASDSVQVAPE